MNMDYKVDNEIRWDRYHNRGMMMKGVMGIVIRHQPPEADWTAEEHNAIADVLGNNALARIVEWRDRAAQQVTLLNENERLKLAWTGSDTVTDINQFRATKIDLPGPE